MLRVLPFLAAAVALAQPSAQERIAAQSVQVIGAIKDGGQVKAASVGGGTILDAHHVVTSTFCCDRTKDGHQKFPVVRIAGNFSPAKLAWNGPGDLAVIEVEKELPAQPLSIIPAKLFREGQPVYTAAVSQKDSPTVSESTAQDLVKLDKVPVSVIRVKATSDSVDAGTGLFDECGNLMGINVLVDGGVQFAFIIDAVAEGLKKTGIQASIADRACGGSSNGEKKSTDKDKEKKEAPGAGWRLPEGGEWVGVAIIAGLIGLALRRKRPAVPASAPAPILEPPAYVPPVVVAKPVKPSLRGVAGQYSGASIPIESATVLGRDPHGANLVFTSEADSVSKRHCSIRWDAVRSVFVLEDLGSTNGTFLATGERLTPGQPRDLHAGNRFYLGDSRNQFEVIAD